MKNTMYKRVLVITLILSMMLTMSPVSAYAAAGGNTASRVSDQYQSVMSDLLGQCDCLTLCTTEVRNPSCLICGEAGASLAGCEGEILITAIAQPPLEVGEQIVMEKTPLENINLPMVLAEDTVWPQISLRVGMANGALSTTKAYGAFVVTAENEDTLSYENNTLFLGSGNYRVAMKSDSASTDKIVVSPHAMATITLSDVNIDVSGTENACAFDMTQANVHLILTGENTLKSGSRQAGLQVPDGASLTITQDSSGSLEAIGGECGAGIGGGHSEASGTIVIRGGNVMATGGYLGAGIGGGSSGAGGVITISGGGVTATGGNFGAGIGGGEQGAGGTIIISGGSVTAIGDTYNEGIGGGFNASSGDFSTSKEGNALIIASSIEDQSGKHDGWNGVIIEEGNGAVYGSVVTLTTDGEIPQGKTLTIARDKTLNIDSGKTLTVNGLLINEGILAGQFAGTGTVLGNLPIGLPDDLKPTKNNGIINIENGSIVINSYGYQQGDQVYVYDVKNEGITVTGTTTKYTIIVAEAAQVQVTLKDVNINVSSISACAFDMTGATVSLTLVGENTLRSGKNKAGLHVPDGANLTIREGSTGSLEVVGGDYGAGIGGGNGRTGGMITISGGRVTANSSNYAAGIGGGKNGNGGTITITGGNVVANGGNFGAGIGGGSIDGGNGGNGGIITITGGNVTASGGNYGAGIGGGGNIKLNKCTGGGTITISGGSVTATGKSNSAGIGGEGTVAGDFSTGNDGNALIIASSISDTSGRTGEWSGVIFEGDNGLVYGRSITLTTDGEIPAGKILTIEGGKTLTVDSGKTLTNEGTIIVHTDGQLAIDANGIFNHYGTLDGPGEKPGEADMNTQASNVTLTVLDGAAPVTYGSKITLTAAITEEPAAVTMRATGSVSRTEVIFYCDGVQIGTARAMQQNGILAASAEVTLNTAVWTAGEHHITAEYVGGMQLLSSTSEPITLTVNRGERSFTSVIVSSNSAVLGCSVPTIIPITVEDQAIITYSAVADIFGAATAVADISGDKITLKAAGDFYVKAVIGATDYYNEKILYSDKITVSQADSDFNVVVKNGEIETTQFTYGDMITIEVGGIAAKQNNSTNKILAKDQIYLYDKAPNSEGAAVLASADVKGTAAILTYDTADKRMTIGNSQTIYVVYGGNDNLNASVKAMTVSLSQKPLTATVTTEDNHSSRSYDGTNRFNDLVLLLDGVVGGDMVVAKADGTAPNAAVGENYVFTAASAALAGADHQWYTLAISDISGTVKITPAAALSLRATVAMAKHQPNHQVELDLTSVSHYPASPGGTPLFRITSNGYNGLTSASIKADGKTLILVADNTGNSTDDTVTIRITNMGNYIDSTISVIVSYTDKHSISIDGVTAATDLTYNGQPQIGYTGTPTSYYTGRYDISYSGTGATRYGPTDIAPTYAGSYAVTFRVPSSSAVYSGSTTVNFTIAPKAVIIRPKDHSVSKSETMPDLTLQYDGLISGDVLMPSVVPELICAASDTQTTGNYAITWRNMDKVSFIGQAASNYAITKMAIGTMTITDKLFRVTLTNGGIGASGSGNYAGGTSVAISAGIKNGYTFKRWISSQALIFADAESTSTTFIMPEQDISLSAIWQEHSDSYGDDVPVLVPSLNGEIDAAVDRDGNATVIVADNTIHNALEERQKQTDQNSSAVILSIHLSQKANQLNVVFSKTALDQLIDHDIQELKIASALISISFDKEALKAIEPFVQEDLTIIAKKRHPSVLPLAAQSIIGDRPVFELTLQSGGNAITRFDKGSAFVQMPYTLAVDENISQVLAVYIDEKGEVMAILRSNYDPVSKTVNFRTGHFSTYGVGYWIDAPIFSDTADHWAKDDIAFTVACGLFSGTGSSQFSPDIGMTRGMMIAVIERLEALESLVRPSQTFIEDSHVQYDTIMAAAQGVNQGFNCSAISPEAVLTRQELAVMLTYYNQIMGYHLPQTQDEIAFVDQSQIADWAKDAVKAMQLAGVVYGRDGNRFDPTGYATRAEAAAVIRRYLALISDQNAV